MNKKKRREEGEEEGKKTRKRRRRRRKRQGRKRKGRRGRKMERQTHLRLCVKRTPSVMRERRPRGGGEAAADFLAASRSEAGGGASV